MTNQPVPVIHQYPAIPTSIPPTYYLPDSPDETLAPPVFKIVQAPSRSHTEEGIEMGKFFSAETGELVDRLDTVIMSIRLTRTYWGKEMNTPLCSSDDRINPRPGGWSEGPCAQCEKRDDVPWLKREEMCVPGYVIIAVRSSSGDPFMLRVGGTSANSLRALRTILKTKFRGIPFCVALELSTRKEKNEKGVYFTLKYNIAKVFSVEEIANWKIIADNLVGIEIPEDTEQEPLGKSLDEELPF